MRFLLALLVFFSVASYGQNLKLRRCFVGVDGKMATHGGLLWRHYDSAAVHEACYDLVMRAANHGYPFASVTADSAVVAGGRGRRVDLYCSMTLAQKYHVENVFLLGGGGLSPYYVYSLTGIAPGSPYREDRVQMAARRISGGAAVATRDAEVEFHPGGDADVYLYIDSRRQNAVGASLALNRDDGDGGYFVTGNALADLCNNFGHGERMRLEWNGYARRSQMLDVGINCPYVFNTPLTPDITLNMTSSDTLCLTIAMRAALGFALSPDLGVEAVADVRRLVSTSDGSSDARTSLYGIGVNWRRTMQNHARINVSSCWTGGTRRYDGGSGAVSEVSAGIVCELPLCAWARYEGEAKARQLYSAVQPDIHECSPIGGVGSLRGFMANELRATGFVTICNTLRVLLPEGFSVLSFYDQSFYKCAAVQPVRRDAPSGFGIGAGIKAGNASIDIGWAIGRESGELRPLKDVKTLIITKLSF